MAGQLFALALPALMELTSPGVASAFIGIHEYLRRLSGDSLVNQTRETLTSGSWNFRKDRPNRTALVSRGSDLRQREAPTRLILTGRTTGQQAVLERGLQPCAG